MNLLLFLDGRPGHEKQSQAIVYELSQLIDLEVKVCSLQKVSFFRRMAELVQIVFGKRLPGFAHGSATLLLGTGSRTHLPMLAAGLRSGIPVLTCMAPEPLLRSFFSLCFVPRHDKISAGINIFLTDGPPVPGGSRNGHLTREDNRGVVLVGGIKEKSHIWDDEKIVGDIEKIVEEFDHVQWHVTSSPRTPDTTEMLLKKLAETYSNVLFTPFDHCSRGWVEEQYERSTYAIVTGDSASMLYEAVTAGCKVGVVPVGWKNRENKFKSGIDILAADNVVLFLDGTNAADLENVKTGQLNEARRCAMEIVQRYATSDNT